jgi:hypothetical protein
MIPIVVDGVDDDGDSTIVGNVGSAAGASV